MWLPDANLDIHLVGLLRSYEIDCDTAENRGWKALRNGDLVAAAAGNGFDSLVTKDQLFAESASRIWRLYPKFAIVVVTLPQLPSQRYMEAFARAWAAQPIRAVPGEIVNWPESKGRL
jgi:hypothetical protein